MAFLQKILWRICKGAALHDSVDDEALVAWLFSIIFLGRMALFGMNDCVVVKRERIVNNPRVAMGPVAAVVLLMVVDFLSVGYV